VRDQHTQTRHRLSVNTIHSKKTSKKYRNKMKRFSTWAHAVWHWESWRAGREPMCQREKEPAQAMQ
jgi:hypothetical protein